MTEMPCILVNFNGHNDREFTVAEYNALQRPRKDQVLWARVVPAVEHLTTEPSWPYGPHIVDEDTYRTQMRVLIGLDEP